MVGNKEAKEASADKSPTINTAQRAKRRLAYIAGYVGVPLILAACGPVPADNSSAQATTAKQEGVAMFVTHGDTKIFSYARQELGPIHETTFQETIEVKYGIRFDGKWTDEQIKQVAEILDEVPPTFIAAKPGTVFHVGINYSSHDGSQCDCQTLATKELVRRRNARQFPPELDQNHRLIIAEDAFSNQIALRRMVIHELIHNYADSTYLINFYGDDEIHLNYDKALKKIIGMPFNSYADLVKTRLSRKYPKLYHAVQYAVFSYKTDLSNPDEAQIDIVEVISSRKYRTLDKVARLSYAVGYREDKPTILSHYPAEFLPVLGEWYAQGQNAFHQNTDDILGEKIANKLYNYLQYGVFSGYRYDNRGQVIKPGRISRDLRYVTPHLTFRER